MEEKIKEANKLYKPTLDIVEKFCNDLKLRKIGYTLGFYNNHELKIGKVFIKEFYPIPVVSLKINKYEIDIGFDIVTDKDYIGFIELTLDKEKVLNFDYDKIKEFNFEIYGYENYLIDYYGGDVENTKRLIHNSNEIKFHIGFNISKFSQVKVILGLLEKMKT